jgi:phosphatidylinositol-3-phosphatase
MKTLYVLGKAAASGTLWSLLVFTFSCGGGGVGIGNGGTTPPSSAHVVVVVEENHSYSQVIGNSAMPYLNGLASQYGLATQYYGDVHPSIGNYLMLTTGVPETIDDSFSGTISDDNVVRELVKANKTWHSYAESLPSVGYVGGDVYPYLRHHNPFTYLSDVNGTSQANNLVPFSQFASDVSAASLPDYSFVVPNALNDAHDGTLQAADQWLQSNIDPLIKSSTFQSNGLLVIVFDESVTSDLSHGGGHVAMVVLGPKVKRAFQSTTVYQHQSTLRLTLSTLGVNSYPGAAAIAPDMGEFF